MTVLAVLQNQWFPKHEVARVREMYERAPFEHRLKYNAFFLFRSCHTGKVLRAVFGDECMKWKWANASPVIGSEPSSFFKPDPEHCRAVLDLVKPHAVLAFGKPASDTLYAICATTHRHLPLVMGPHPAARGALKHQELGRMKQQLFEALRYAPSYLSRNRPALTKQ